MLDDTHARALPRGLRYLCVREMDASWRYTAWVEKPRGNLLELTQLPQNLIELHWEGYLNSNALSKLPRSLRACHIHTLLLPPTPPSLLGITGAFSSWLTHVITGTDPNQGNMTEDLVREAMSLLPPGCLCTSRFMRDGEWVLSSIVTSLAPMSVLGDQPDR
jgi:hypothetical protein